MMSKDGVEEGSGRTMMNVPVGAQTSKRSLSIEELGEQLLPGIPDEITLDYITSKLPWRALHILPSLSRRWQHAIQSRLVYDARVRFHSTETLVVVNHRAGPMNFIALYSIRDKSFYFLPSIPDVDGGVPYSCQCVSLGGKIYVLGGLKNPTSDLGSEKVYVLDLVGQRHWKQCGSMQEPRVEFGCGVIDGKIYVFGGFSCSEIVRGSEVYDPEVNAWSPIMPMISLRWDFHVAVVGKELFVHGGGFCDSDHPDSAVEEDIDIDHIHDALFLEAYDPDKNEWRKVEAFGRNSMEKVFVAQGKFYSMTRLDIHVHDIEKRSWTYLHSFSFEALGPIDCVSVEPIAVQAVTDELLAAVHWYRRDNHTSGVSLLQSSGFGRENKRIVWYKANGSLSFGYFLFMYPVQL